MDRKLAGSSVSLVIPLLSMSVLYFVIPILCGPWQLRMLMSSVERLPKYQLIPTGLSYSLSPCRLLSVQDSSQKKRVFRLPEKPCRMSCFAHIPLWFPRRG